MGVPSPRPRLGSRGIDKRNFLLRHVLQQIAHHVGFAADDTRKAWIKAAPDEAERIERGKSDSLAEVNHAGERAVFYSTRHGHGTAVADAGVAEKDIAASMHCVSRGTTRCYLHSNRRSLHDAIARMTDLDYDPPLAATGTPSRIGGDHSAYCTASCADRCATGSSRMESGGVKASFGETGKSAGAPGNSQVSPTFGESERVAQLVEQRTFNP
jgi:hypothetical protein